MKKFLLSVFSLLIFTLPLQVVAQQEITPLEDGQIIDYENGRACVQIKKAKFTLADVTVTVVDDVETTTYTRAAKPNKSDFEDPAEFKAAKKSFNKNRKNCRKRQARKKRQQAKKKANKNKQGNKSGGKKKGGKNSGGKNKGGAGDGIVNSLTKLPLFLNAMNSGTSADPSGPYINMTKLSKIGGATQIFFSDFTTTASAVSGGTPTAQQCDTLRGTDTDGDDSALVGCWGAEDSLYPFEKWLNAGKELCYLTQLGDPRAIKSGMVRPVSGAASAIGKILQTPATSRIIQFNVSHPTDGDSKLFLQVLPKSDRDEGSTFQVNTWTCATDGTTPIRYNTLSINESGVLDLSFVQNDTDKYSIDFSGTLEKDADDLVNFSSADRTLSITHGGSETFKSVSLISNTLITRMFRVGDHSRQTITAANYQAQSAERVLLPSYAVRSRFGDNTTNDDEVDRGVEFRRIIYASAPDASGGVNSISFDEAFFETAPNTDDITTDIFSCSASPAVTFTLNLTGSDDFTGGVIEDCDTSVPEDTNFCSGDTDIAAAESSYIDNCSSS